ncbi:flagellar basal body P-ring formation chaperone FlgA [uncultured Stenotrophomonas sp.]|uniref:flagellar basal body P-ring formation chaperone FlgA n=1 Tax=uncultured Stenotrophomonas sp. TaxID=165438 RepID=UPI0025CD41C8|nr:flagellar basal body P-ring formation chaperone FlgA [uncultured Stenotrophomonas sp.]
MHSLILMLALASPTAAHSTPAPLSGQYLAARVVETVQARLQAQGSSAIVSVLGRVADVTGVGADPEVEVGTVAGRWPRARASVPVRLTDSRGTRRLVTVWLAASDLREVLAYSNDYPAMVPAEKLQATPVRIDMACCEGPAIATLADVRGKRLRRAVHAGRPVLAEDLTAAPEVAAQQQVTLAVERGAVRIVVAGTALASGRLGERIQVRPQGSQRAVQARVSAPAEVVIDE